LTTGYVDSVRGMTDGEFDVLLKPFSGEALARAVGGVR
jgi:DNA-binding response OmpR family regulator